MLPTTKGFLRGAFCLMLVIKQYLHDVLKEVWLDIIFYMHLIVQAVKLLEPQGCFVCRAAATD